MKPHVRKGKKKTDKPAVTVELTDFNVFYSQDSIKNAEETLKNKGSKIVVEKGQIVKVTKDAIRRMSYRFPWAITLWAFGPESQIAQRELRP